MYIHKDSFEPLVVSGEGNYYLGIDKVPDSLVEEVCDVCEEPGTDADPLGHFSHPETFGRYVICHGQCGEDQGLQLA